MSFSQRLCLRWNPDLVENKVEIYFTFSKKPINTSSLIVIVTVTVAQVKGEFLPLIFFFLHFVKQICSIYSHIGKLPIMGFVII